MHQYTLYSIQKGKGPTIVLLHGITGSARYWKKIQANLSKDFNVIALDMLGFGRSPKPDAIEYTLDDHNESIDCTLRKLHVNEPFLLVGHSMGALLALSYATRFPQKIIKLLLLSPPFYSNPIEAQENIVKGSHLPKMMLYGSSAKLVCMLHCKLRPLIIPFMPFLFRTLPPDVAKDILLHTWNSYSKSLKHIVEQQEYKKQIALCTFPTVILFGSDDSYATIDTIKSIEQLNPSISVTRVTEANHDLPLKRPEIVLDAIRASF